MKHVFTRPLYVALGLIVLVPGAFAQAPGAIEELIVTARKREERLQDVPLAITAFSAEQMTQH